jgi:hypothetical protein
MKEYLITLYRLGCVCVLADQKVERATLDWCLWSSNKIKLMNGLLDTVIDRFAELRLYRFIPDDMSQEDFMNWLTEQKILYGKTETYTHYDYKNYNNEDMLHYAALSPNSPETFRIYYNMTTDAVLWVVQRYNNSRIFPYKSGIAAYGKHEYKELEGYIIEAFKKYGGVNEKDSNYKTKRTIQRA